MTLLRRALVAATALSLGVAGALVIAAPASAAGCVVDTVADTVNDGTLRAAVENGSCSVVTFDSSFDTAKVITLDGALGPIDIAESKLIQGPGSGLLTVTRGSDPTDYNMFELAGDAVLDVRFTGLTITGNDDGTVGWGSAIQSIDSDVRNLTLTDVVISSQNAQHGAALDVQSLSGDLSISSSDLGFNDAGNSGGALYALGVAGTILFDNTFVHNNTADDLGGGVAINPEDLEDPTPTVVIFQNGTIFQRNNAGEQGGGASVNMAASVTAADSSFSDNFSSISGGGLYVADLTGVLTIAGSVFTGNGATSGGALSTNNPGLISISTTQFLENGAGGGGAILAVDFGTLNIDESSFTANLAGIGGALQLGGMGFAVGGVTITNTDFVENVTETGVGGAINANAVTDAPFTIARSNFLRNATDGGETGEEGGAIYVNELAQDFAIDSSTFAGNTTGGEDGVSVYVGSVLPGEGSLFSIVNSTFDESHPASMIHVNQNQGTFSIAYSTLVGFEPVHVGDSPGAETVVSTIVQSAVGQADLFGEDDPFATEYSILSKPLDTLNITDLGNNQFSTNALLGPLQNNGGRTDTRLPASNSPALSKGGPSLGAPAFDQRFTGFPRIVGTLDVGAVEIPPALAATGSTGLPVWVPIVGAIVLLAGIGFVVFSVLSRRKGAGAVDAADSSAEQPAEPGPGTGGDAVFPEASTEPPTAEPPTENDPR
jgi:hypothetical protein